MQELIRSAFFSSIIKVELNLNESKSIQETNKKKHYNKRICINYINSDNLFVFFLHSVHGPLFEFSRMCI